jgi:hypothetical protein
MKERILVSTVGYLVGDAWLFIANLIQRCAINDIHLICGSYALPVFEFVQKHISGADFVIDRVIDNPDDASHHYCPGYGNPAIDRAIDVLGLVYPGLIRLGDAMKGYEVNEERYPLQLRQELPMEDHVVIQTYTRHDWKNLNNALGNLRFKSTAYQVGLPGEPTGPYVDLRNASYEDQVIKTITAKCAIGVASSFACLRSVFCRPQIIASYTPDVSYWPHNPDAKKLITPSAEELQALIEAEDL